VGVRFPPSASLRSTLYSWESQQTSVDVARRFAQALDREDTEAAAFLHSDDAELVFPGTTLRGREAWRQARVGQGQPEHLTESVEDAVFTESDETVGMTARLVQRWAETGEIANEPALLVRVRVDGGLISRLAFVPGRKRSVSGPRAGRWHDAISSRWTPSSSCASSERRTHT
jgi:ketosteroid isomerase-like protein